VVEKMEARVNTADECWVCRRITPNIILESAGKVWVNKQTSRKLGQKALEIIKECYLRKPTFFCGRSSASILSGLFYILGVEYKALATKYKVASALGVTEVTVRQSYKRWLNYFPDMFKNFWKSYQQESVRS